MRAAREWRSEQSSAGLPRSQRACVRARAAMDGTSEAASGAAPRAVRSVSEPAAARPAGGGAGGVHRATSGRAAYAVCAAVTRDDDCGLFEEPARTRAVGGVVVPQLPVVYGGGVVAGARSGCGGGSSAGLSSCGGGSRNFVVPASSCCAPTAPRPPPLPVDYLLSRQTTLLFTRLAYGGTLLAAVARALASAGVDAEAESPCALRCVAWTAGAGTGASDCARFSLRLFSDMASGGVLAEFHRTGGCALTFWRSVRSTHSALAAAAGRAGCGFGAVAPLVPLGVDAVRRDMCCGGGALVVAAADVRALAGMVGAEFVDVSVEGCKMAVAVAAGARLTTAGALACVEFGLVAQLARVCVGAAAAAAAALPSADAGCGWDLRVEAATAAAATLAELWSTPEGRAALAGADGAADAGKALAVLAATGASCAVAARQLAREATRAVGGLRAAPLVRAAC